MRDAGSEIRDLAALGAMRTFDALDEDVELSAKQIQLSTQITADDFVRERAGFKERFQVLDGFIARRMSEHKKPNELLLVTSTAEALDNVRGYRLRGAPDLATFFEHLEFR